MEKRIIQLGRQIKKKVGSELRRVARTYLDKHNNTCVRCNREDVPIKSMHVCHVGPLLSDKVEEDTRQLMGEYQSSGQLNFETYDDVIEFEGMFEKKMVDQTLVKHAEQRICTILACAECNGKYEREDPSKIKRASSWETSRYGTLIPCRDAGRASEKSARPSDIRYFMGVRGNDTNVSDSDSTNANGGSVSDSDDIYDDDVSDSDSSGEDNSVFSEGHAFETPMSDSPGSKCQRVGSESEEESHQNKKLRRSCVAKNQPKIKQQNCTESDVDDWYKEECEFVEGLDPKTTTMRSVKNSLKSWLKEQNLLNKKYQGMLMAVLDRNKHVVSDEHGKNEKFVHNLRFVSRQLGSKRQRVGSESEDESPQNKKLRRSCVGRPDYSHSGQHLLPSAGTQALKETAVIQAWYDNRCTRNNARKVGCRRQEYPFHREKRVKAKNSFLSYIKKHHPKFPRLYAMTKLYDFLQTRHKMYKMGSGQAWFEHLQINE